jgi:aminoglycoside phosphotransferase (APT) family kinase protein
LSVAQTLTTRTIHAAQNSFNSAAALPLQQHLGFSALALLGPASLPSLPVLFLLNWSCASLEMVQGAGLKSTQVPLRGWTLLPLQSNSVSCVVADFDAVPNAGSLGVRILAEIRRVLAPEGCCVAVTAHRRRPRDPRLWSRYRLVPPVRRWLRTFDQHGWAQRDAVLLQFDGPRLTSVQLGPEPCRSGTPKGRADAVALVRSGCGAAETSRLGEVSRALTDCLAVQQPVDRIYVRKIGKTAAFLSLGDSRIVVRMPGSMIALARARRNYLALDALHRKVIPTEIPTHLVPRPLTQGVAGNQPYFVESCVPGAPRRAAVAQIRWEPQALEFITSLHVATARPQLLTDAWFEQTVEPALSNIDEWRHDPGNRDAIAWLRARLRERLIGQQLPVVRSHGDFTAGHCLYDSSGRLSGVVDWELSTADGLPLLDLIQCVDLPVEYTSDGRWLRAELVFDAVEGAGPLSGAPEIIAYMKRLSLPEALLPSLLMMFWIDHAASRIAARRSDERWFQGRVKAPLRRVRQLAERSG